MSEDSGRVSGDVWAKALEQYERMAAYLRRGVMTHLEATEAYGLPDAFRDRLAEEQDRREWVEGIRRRLGLVAEVHRCRVFKGNPEWIWSCERCRCFAAQYFCQSQAEAFGKALAHARSFIPEPPEETPVTELDLVTYEALAGVLRAEQESFGAALPGRMAIFAKGINEGLAGLLPDEMRFEWSAGGA